MSKIALEGNASGTGTFTIASPNSNSNYTLTLPSSTGTVVVTGGAQTIEFAAGSAASPSITFTGDTNTGIFSPAADTIAFAEGGAEAMRIDSSGNVGIGTSSPTDEAGYGRALDIRSATGAAIYLRDSDDTTNDTLIVGRDSSNSYIDSKSGALIIYNAGSERMRIDNSGNVGIGTSSPLSRLSVSASTSDGLVANFSRGTSADPNLPNTYGKPYIRIGGPEYDSNYTDGTYQTIGCGFISGSNVGPAEIGFQITDWSDYGKADIVFATRSSASSNVAPTERARITSGGVFLVNTTSTSFSSGGTSYTPYVGVNAGSSAGAYFQTSTSGAFFVLNNTLGSSTRYYISFDAVNTRAGDITYNGSVMTYGGTSDYRLKENIVPLADGLQKVMEMRPVSYVWKHNGVQSQGFLAHEIQEVVPDAATGTKDEVNADGNPIYQQVDPRHLVATLTAAIQELKAITDAQATRIEALEAEVAALKGQ